MSNYRKIWEDANGPIPYDNSGRKMEIHHKDGDRNNNELSNLELLTITEHYNIHYEQNDWAACQSIINRMNVSPEEKRKSCSELVKKRFADGTHHFINPEFIKQDSIRKSIRNKGSGNPMYGKEVTSETRLQRSKSHKKLVAQGIHPLQSSEHKDRMKKRAIKELQAGVHAFQQIENIQKAKDVHQQMLVDKTHPFNNSKRIDPNKLKKWCNICNKEVTSPVFGRFHKH